MIEDPGTARVFFYVMTFLTRFQVSGNGIEFRLMLRAMLFIIPRRAF